jgi:hypothetical protein
MGEEFPCNSILNSKRISFPRDPRSPNQPLAGSKKTMPFASSFFSVKLYNISIN